MKKTTLTFLLSFCFLFIASNANSQAGSLDNTFGVGGKVITDFGGNDDDGNSVCIQSDGKIVVAGNSYNGLNNDFAIARYNTDGSLDISFGIGGKVTIDFSSSSENGNALAIQFDGKIVIGGHSNVAGGNDFAVARLNTDGSLDNSFDSDGKNTTDFDGGPDISEAIIIQPDGKIILAGRSQSASEWNFGLVRYNTNGSPDSTFDLDGKLNAVGIFGDVGFAVELQADGKIIVAGSSLVGSNKDFTIARINSDGTIDSTFDFDGYLTTDFGTFPNEINSIKLQSDGKIIATGSSYVGSLQVFTLVRYNINGSLDTSFDIDGKVTTAIGSSSAISTSVAIQGDGKVVVAGHSSSAIDFAIARYNINGSLDTMFNSSGIVLTDFGGPFDYGTSIAIQLDGKIVVAGFTHTGIYEDFAIARYNNDLVGITEVNMENSINIFPNPTTSQVTISVNNPLTNASLKIINLTGQVLVQQNNISGTSFTLDVSAQPAGLYFLEINEGDKISRIKFVKE